MSIITGVAFFQICPDCGQHATILRNEEELTPFFISKEAGLYFTKNLLLENKISSLEYEIIVGMITSSGLLEKSSDSEVVSMLSSLVGGIGKAILNDPNIMRAQNAHLN